MKRYILFLLFQFLANSAYSQSANAPLNTDYYHLIDRYEILSGKFSNHFHTTVKPYQRMAIAGFADELLQDSVSWQYIDRSNLLYLANDNWEYSEYQDNTSRKPFLKSFYRSKSDLYHVKDVKDFDLHINPIFYFSGGMESASDVTTYRNTRGVDIRGNISKKLGFYSYITTTQVAEPLYVRNWVKEKGVIPYEGFWKQYNTDGYDYFTAKGYFTFDLVKDYVNAQFGFDKNNFGNGYRTLFLSDFSNGYTFLKFNTKIWKINYTNIFAQGIAEHLGGATGSSGTERYPKKFITSHHLSINITDNINIGLFEAIISGDSTESFNISYMNPIIFYRALEHQDGSIDNAMVGFDFKVNFARHFSLYGQLLLDEFKLDEIKSGDGWWANKFGIQTGLKYINVFGIRNLDGQIEYNLARPYLYQHSDIYTNYAHYSMPLGHIQGGNFEELIGILRFQASKKLNFVAQLNLTKYGEDENTNANWGKDVMKSYTTREMDYGNTIGQGISTNLLYAQLTGIYQLKHNIFIDLTATYRKLDSQNDSLDENNTYFSGSFRWNMPRRTHDF